MAEAKLYGQNKGGMSINGIIKDYYAYAGENISAGDLVEFVNGIASKTDYGTSVDTQISTLTESGDYISALALDENKVFVVHSYYTSSTYVLYGLVVAIDGATITYGTDTKISGGLNSGVTPSACLLPNGNVFITYSYSANYYLYGIVCSVSGTTITVGTGTQLNTTRSSHYSSSTCLLPNGNVFITHSYTSDYYLYGVVCSVDGTTITAGADTALVSLKNAGYAISTCLLPNGNVFIAHSYDSNFYLYGIVVSISGTTITKGSDVAIATSQYNGYSISTTLLKDGRILMAHPCRTSNYYLAVSVCTVNNTSITVDVSCKELIFDSGAGQKASACSLLNGDVLLFHKWGASNKQYLYGVVCKVEGTEVAIGTDTELSNVTGSGSVIDTLLLNNGTIFTAHSGSEEYLYAQIFGIDYENNVPTKNIIATEYETQVRKVTTGQFDGIAKTSGEGGDDTGHKDIVSIWTKFKEVIPEGTQQVAMADGKQLYDANGDIFLVREAS